MKRRTLVAHLQRHGLGLTRLCHVTARSWTSSRTRYVGSWASRFPEVTGTLECTLRSKIACPPVIHSDPDILGRTPVFVGTRLPFRNLIDSLERGHSLDEFLDEFPSVSREQAVAALEAAHEAVSAGARPAR